MAEQQRVKIACPECGAPLPPEAATRAVVCGQCHHTSAPAASAAPAVQTVVVERVIVAQAPGAPGERGGAGTASCPRCKAALFATTVHEVTLLGCGLCGGIFLDNDGSTYVTRRADPEIARLADRAATHGAGRPLDERGEHLCCPVCAATMSRARVGGIDLDVCVAHGTWFDRGELHRVIDAYAEGRESSASRASRQQSEAMMAQFREDAWERNARDEAQSSSILAGVSVGVLGLLGAIASGSRS
jgi:Zn-finger nucleic acid-binding protein